MCADSDLLAAAALLPLWVQFGSLIFSVLFAGLGAAVGGAICAALTLRTASRTAAAAWPERARSLFAARQSMVFNALVMGVGVTAMTVSSVGPFSAATRTQIGVDAGVLAFVIGLAWCRFVTTRLRPDPPPLRQALRNGAGVMVLALSPYVVVAAAIPLAPTRLDASLAAWLMGTAAVALFMHWVVATRLARLLGILRPAPEHVVGAVAVAAARTGIEPTAVYEMDWPSANALALQSQDAIAFSGRAVACLRDDEITAVAAHELGHLAETRGVVLLRLLRALLLVPVVALPALVQAYGWLAIPLLLLGILVLARLFAGLSRRWEARADAVSCDAADGPTFARALEAIHRAELLPVVFNRGASHPDCYDRLLAAGVTPGYPRPEPPDARAGRPVLFVGVATAVAVALLAPIVLNRIADAAWDDVTRLHLQLLLDARVSEPAVAQLARLRIEDGDPAGAATLYRAAAELAEPAWIMAAYSATAHALDGRCTAAADDSGAARELFAERYGADTPDPLLRQTAAAVDACGRAAAPRTVARR